MRALPASQSSEEKTLQRAVQNPLEGLCLTHTLWSTSLLDAPKRKRTTQAFLRYRPFQQVVLLETGLAVQGTALAVAPFTHQGLLPTKR